MSKTNSFNTQGYLRPGLGAFLVAIVALGAATLAPSRMTAAVAAAGSAASTETATFGAGCFWCVETDFEKVPGVITAVSGYMGGTTADPTYKQVSSGTTGHIEVVQLTYDPAKVTYNQLLDYYWRHVDLLDGGGQFCDRGDPYRPVIFADGPIQKGAAVVSKSALDASKRFDRPIAVTIEPAAKFTAAEDYHQDYAAKNPVKYQLYRLGCGRDARLKTLWGGKTATH